MRMSSGDVASFIVLALLLGGLAGGIGFIWKVYNETDSTFRRKR